jgi:mono/diheme cytochrome c family protein
LAWIKAEGRERANAFPMAQSSPMILGAAAMMWLSLGGPPPAHSADVIYGRRIAERYCSGCHAIGSGQSPNPHSPPFRKLYKRYRVGGLEALLTEGMVAPTSPPEEGGAPMHPKMPQAVLGEDEIAALKAYLHSLEPPRRRPTAQAAGR